VRVSPDFVVTSDIENTKLIYGNKQIKSNFYKGYGKLNGYQFMLGVEDCNTRSPASVARKNLVHIFSQQNLLRMGEMMQDHLANFNRWLEDKSDRNEVINAYASFRLLTLDIIANLTFGGNLHLVDQGNPNHEIIRFIDAVVSHNSTAAQIPYMDEIINILPIPSLKNWKKDSEGLAIYGKKALEDWYSRGGLEGTKNARDICAKLKEHGQQHPEEAISEGHLVTILSEVLLAGSDTTSTTASYIAFELAMQPDIQHKLRKELIDAFPDPNQRFPIPQLLKLPYLDGLCKEILRMYPIVPGPLERHNTDPMTLDGYYIPPMTKVGIQPWTQHYDPKVFPNPNQVIPERYLPHC
jgi:benzoate 4-monooxygenase